MGRWLGMRWSGDPAGASRADRRPCAYEAYEPDALAGREFAFPGETAAAVSEAEAALVRLDERADAMASGGPARLLLRAESVASSRIEGLEISERRLLRADAARRDGREPLDRTAVEVLGNVDAMSWGVERSGPDVPITPDLLLELHRRLCAGTRLERYGGRLRRSQNWIGGNPHNPCSADFVPPPPDLVPGLLDDLCAFLAGDALPPLAQAAVAHAQFETIHPFADGNGRAGRVLIHLVLRRRGLALRAQPPISLALSAWRDAYVGALAGTRHDGPPEAEAARAGVARWVELCAAACARAATAAADFEERVRALREDWRERAGRPRAGSSASLIIDALPSSPVLGAAAAAEAIGRSFQSANEAIGRLAAAGVLQPIAAGRRNRVFEAPELIEAFADLERRLAIA